ncbi:MAG: GNAT family N-acetyltransferase [Lachnospiraceae bacterium]|nr:GNAT family N-acetyltransferase [Lachnospiraceae bacterium]
MEIRHIQKSDDRLAISRIYEESWKFAYKDIIPESYLESIPAGCWASNIEKEGMNTLVLIEDGMFIGTSSYCKSRFSDFSDLGEIVSIYFLPQYIGKGYGKLLLDAVIEELGQLGFDEIFLWVLEDNLRARKFYEKAGFTPSGNYLNDNIGGKDLREMQYKYIL